MRCPRCASAVEVVDVVGAAEGQRAEEGEALAAAELVRVAVDRQAVAWAGFTIPPNSPDVGSRPTAIARAERRPRRPQLTPIALPTIQPGDAIITLPVLRPEAR